MSILAHPIGEVTRLLKKQVVHKDVTRGIHTPYPSNPHPPPLSLSLSLSSLPPSSNNPLLLYHPALAEKLWARASV